MERDYDYDSRVYGSDMRTLKGALPTSVSHFEIRVVLRQYQTETPF